MAVEHSVAAAQAATNAVVDLIDGGVGDNGTLEILEGASVLVVLDLNDPAFGNADAEGDAALDTEGVSAAASGAGDADKYIFKNKAGVVVFQGVVAESGEDMDIDNTSINIGQVVSIDDFKYNAGQTIIE
jgi:hypothetical protein